MVRPRIEVPRERLAELCKHHRIRRLALFGSVLRDDFSPDSDIDVLVDGQTWYYRVHSVDACGNEGP